MPKKKRIRGLVPAPDPGDELTHLHLLWIRVDYLRKLWSEAAAGARATKDLTTALTLEGGFGVPVWACVTLFLASLYTVVEGWRRIRGNDAMVEAALSDVARVARLKDLRDGVFHYGAINNPAVTGIVGDREMLKWAATLHAALRKYMQKRPSKARPN